MWKLACLYRISFIGCDKLSFKITRDCNNKSVSTLEDLVSGTYKEPLPICLSKLPKMKLAGFGSGQEQTGCLKYRNPRHHRLGSALAADGEESSYGIVGRNFLSYVLTGRLPFGHPFGLAAPTYLNTNSHGQTRRSWKTVTWENFSRRCVRTIWKTSDYWRCFEAFPRIFAINNSLFQSKPIYFSHSQVKRWTIYISLSFTFPSNRRLHSVYKVLQPLRNRLAINQWVSQRTL